MSSILFLYEGAKKEKKFCNFIINRFFDVDNRKKSFFAYGANIYSLYSELSNDYGLDIVSLVKESARAKGDLDSYKELVNSNFSEVFLIFDFDPHDPQYDSDKILEMLKYFDNETENGKLYINYPMMESFNHFVSIPDLNYNNYKISVNDCHRYKKYINEISCVKYFGIISEKSLDNIVAQNLDKYEYISGTSIDNYDLYLNNFSQINLFMIQVNNINLYNYLYVFNTSVFWGIDYYGRKNYDKYIDIKKGLK